MWVIACATSSWRSMRLARSSLPRSAPIVRPGQGITPPLLPAPEEPIRASGVSTHPMISRPVRPATLAVAALLGISACHNAVAPRPAVPVAAPPSASAAPAPAPPPPAPPAPRPSNDPPPWTPGTPPDVEIGTAAPTLVQAVAPDGRWVAICQARVDTNHDGYLETRIGPHGDPYGDKLVPYFVEGKGPGRPVDDFLGADPSGRFVALLIHGRPTLRDTTTGREVALAGEPSPVDFGETEVVYTRKSGAKRSVIVRALSTGLERSYDPGPGELLSLALFDRARALRVVMKLPSPGASDYYHTDLYRGRCAGPAAASYHSAIIVSVREQRLVSLTDGRVWAVPEEIKPFADGWLRTMEGGSLRFETVTGRSREMVPAGYYRVLFANEARGAVVAAFKEGPSFALRLFGGQAPRQLGTVDYVSDSRWVAPFGRHLLLTVRDADDTIIDAETAERRQSPNYQRLVAIRGDRTLVQRRTQLVFLEGGGERTIGEIPEYPPIFGVHDYRTGTAERIVIVGTTAVDMARGEAVGTVPDEPPWKMGNFDMKGSPYKPFGFTKDGWVLVETPPANRVRAMSAVGLGPMRWARLAPPAASAAAGNP
jgi:hypothetical protein